MCRYVFVTLLFLCRSQDVFMQDPVPCVAREVTVGQIARITCIFPPGTITAYSSAFVVKKFTDPSEKDIVECKHPQVSPRENPVCFIQDTSLGYAFTFVPRNDTQTVIIPSVKLSDAGEYGCDRTGHRIDRCNLNVTARVLCEAEEVSVGQRAKITCIFHHGTITPNNGGDFVVKKFPGDSKEEDILVCNHTQGSTSGTPNCVFQNQALGYDFTFVPENDRQTVVIPSVKLSDAGEYGCYRTGHRIDRCNLNVTGDSDRESGQSDVIIVGVTVGVVGVVLLPAVVVLVMYCIKVCKRRQELMQEHKEFELEQLVLESEQLLLESTKEGLEWVQRLLEWALEPVGRLSKDLGDNEPNMPRIIDKLKEIQKRLSNVSNYLESLEHPLQNTQLKKIVYLLEQPAGEDGDRKYQQETLEVTQVLKEINWLKEKLGQAQQNFGQVQQNLSQAQPDLGQAQQDLDQVQRVLGQMRLEPDEGKQLLQEKENKKLHATPARDRQRTVRSSSPWKHRQRTAHAPTPRQLSS